MFTEIFRSPLQKKYLYSLVKQLNLQYNKENSDKDTIQIS